MNTQTSVQHLGITNYKQLFSNKSVPELVEASVLRNEGRIAANGALLIDKNNGERYGRSPDDRFIVKTDGTDQVWWGDINRPISEENWDKIFAATRDYLKDKDLFVFDGYAGADNDSKLQVRIVSEKAWHSLFSRTLFINPEESDTLKPLPDFTVVNACDIELPNWKSMGLNSSVFVLTNFKEKVILIGGSHYGGEIKKSIFSIINYLLPLKGILTMHCSANVGQKGDSALFFGLSGTGKTTLSADPDRRLIGDDEHGWNDNGIFNIEGGCYAKCINLSKDAEPQIFNAIRFGSILENVVVNDHRVPEYDVNTITENTRATYPVIHISNCIHEGVGPNPKNIFFLAADAFGVLPPISKLTPEQAMYHFLSGYTAKLAGTEAGVTEPTATFSACFGAPFMVHHPFVYAKFLGEKMQKHDTKIWLVNTGWAAGSYGKGYRMKIHHTRALLKAALEGKLDNVDTITDEIFGLEVPLRCPNVPEEILVPRNLWTDKEEYEKTAIKLAKGFIENFSNYESQCTDEVKNAGPKIPTTKIPATMK